VVFGPLKEQLRALYAAPVPEGLTVAPETLAAWARQNGLPARAFATPAEAFAAAIAARCENEIVVVAGSLYLVAAVRSMMGNAAGPTVDVSRPSPSAARRDG
jgi:dihydrofolate synthase/folylpolyglutamate synthase